MFPKSAMCSEHFLSQHTSDSFICSLLMSQRARCHVIIDTFCKSFIENLTNSTEVRLLDARIPESAACLFFRVSLRIWHFVSPRCLTRCAINLSNLATPEVEKWATQATHTVGPSTIRVPFLRRTSSVFFRCCTEMLELEQVRNNRKNRFSCFESLEGETQRKDALPEVGAADRVAHGLISTDLNRFKISSTKVQIGELLMVATKAHSFYRLLIRRTEPIFPTA